MIKKTKSKQRHSIPSPITVPPISLPFRSIDWEHFEAFCTDFIDSIPESLRTHRYGVKGDDQEGIDIISDTTDGKHHSYQCRNYDVLGKTQFDKTFNEHEYKSDTSKILVANRVTTEARKACKPHTNWDIWDGEDISREVRKLPCETQWRLVKNHFGKEWVEKFLGLPIDSPFFTVDEYFKRLVDTKRLFHHSWHFVGRNDQIQALDNFVSSSQQIYILEGRGGIGKSKLLKEFAEQFKIKNPSSNLRFVDSIQPLTPEAFEILSSEPYILIIDDAHRKESDVSLLLKVASQNSKIKVILSSRPQGKSLLSSLLTQNHFEPSEVSNSKLIDLEFSDANELASQAVGIPSSPTTHKLAKLSKDCPLILVIGGHLIANKSVPIELLERDDEFRATVLNKFEEEIMGKISPNIDAENVKAVLELISLIQPIYPESPDFLDNVSAFTKIPQIELTKILDELELTGLLLRRGYSFRIIPDVLGDHIATRACITSKAKSNGYAELVYSEFSQSHFASILRNLSELDWRISQTSSYTHGLFEQIWNQIFNEIKEANNAERCFILKKIKDVAYYQPEQVLKIVRYVKNKPATKPEDAEFSDLYKYEHNNVLALLPEILKGISYHLDYLSDCANLMWELGRGDTSRTNSQPEYGIRVLKELAQYDDFELTGKSVAVNKMMLEAVKRWVNDPNLHLYVNSPLDVLDQLLAKDSSTDIYDGGKITFHSFGIHYENTEALREEALKIVLELANSPHLNIALRAVKSLRDALSDPHELYRRRVPDEERAKWRPFQLRIIDDMEGIATKQSHPIIQLEIKSALHWHIKHNKSEEIKKQARQLFKKLSGPFENRLYQALESPHDRDWFIDEKKYDYEKATEMNLKFRQDVAREFISQYPCPEEGFSKLKQLLQDARSCQKDPFPITFFSELTKLDSSYGEKLAEMMLASNDDTISRNFGYILYGLAESSPDKAATLANNAILTENENLVVSAADYYWRGKWVLESFEHVDIKNLETLLNSKFHHAKKLAIGSLGRFSKKDHETAKRLLLNTDLGTDKDLTSEYCDQFNKEHLFDLGTLSDTELKLILEKLVKITDIDHYHIEEFLKYASERLPVEVVEFFIRRIEVSKTKSKRKDDFKPFAYDLSGDFKGITTSPDYLNLLRKIRDNCSDKSWQSYFWYPKLFKFLSLNFSALSLEILLEWIHSGEKEKIGTVGTLLKEAPENFVFQNPNFVAEMLQAAEPYGEEFLREIRSDVVSSTVFRSKSGTPGQPMYEDVELKENSEQALQVYPEGSTLYKLYQSLSKHADKEIEDQLKRDEELLG